MNFITKLLARARRAPTHTAPQGVPVSVAYPGSIFTEHGLFMPTPTPALKQEQFADNHAQVKQQSERQATLYRQIIGQNNRNVTRHQGTRIVDETRVGKYTSELPMSELEWTEVENLKLGVSRIEVSLKKAGI